MEQQSASSQRSTEPSEQQSQVESKVSEPSEQQSQVESKVSEPSEQQSKLKFLRKMYIFVGGVVKFFDYEVDFFLIKILIVSW